MNRRGFLGAAGVAVVGAASGALLLGHSEEIRRVVFAPPDEPPAIWWMHGHVAIEYFISLHSEIEGLPQPLHPFHIKHGWGTRKLDFIAIYLSDTPQPNFEPITYWIPSDVA